MSDDEFHKRRLQIDKQRDDLAEKNAPRTVRVEKAPGDVPRVGRSKWDRLTPSPSTETVLWRGESGGMIVRVTEEDADSTGKRRKRRVHVDSLVRNLTAGQASDLSELLAEASTHAARKRKSGGDT